MNTLILRLLPLALLLAVPGVAAAQNNGDDDDDELGVTMSVMEDESAAGEEGFFNEIELPDVSAEQAQSSAEGGIETANQARDQVQEFQELGKEQAEEGRDRGDTGRGIGDEARGNARPPMP